LPALTPTMQSSGKLLTVFLICFLLSATNLNAQDDSRSPEVDLSVTSSVYGSTGANLPFWFHSNVDGKVDPNGTNFLNEVRFSSRLLKNDNFSIAAGGNLAARLSPENSLHFSELYAKAQLGGFVLSIGKFPQPIGLNNHDLSVGSMTVSRNATPLPKISLSTPEFLDAPLTNGFLEYKVLYSHGWFNEERYVDDVKLHQKYLYLRFNIGRFSATGGLVHNSMWGGTHPTIGELPQGFSDYLRVITGRSAAEGGPGGEVANVLGNSVASYDFAATYRFDSFTASLTRLFYLEDKVSTRFRSPWDGVWGLNLTFEDDESLLNALTYEHINTKQQDAKSFEARGRRDDYNHFLYESGWSYQQRAIGLPLVLFDSDIGEFSNNIIVGHHLGFRGRLSGELVYKTILTYTRNYGRNGRTIPREDFPLAPLRTDQYSLCLSLRHSLQNIENLSVGLAAAADFGELYEDRVGLMVSVRWGNAFGL